MSYEHADLVEQHGGLVGLDSLDSERMSLLKQLEDQFNKTDAAIDRLARRITPALRVSDATIANLSEKALVGRNDSDVVGHLRDTVGRVRDLADRIANLSDRVDL